MEGLAQAAEGLAQVRLVARNTGAAGCVETAEVDGAGERVLDVAGGRGPATVFVGDIVFHSSRGVDFELGGVNGGAEACVVGPGVYVVGVVFWVVCEIALALDVISHEAWEIGID